MSQIATLSSARTHNQDMGKTDSPEIECETRPASNHETKPGNTRKEKVANLVEMMLKLREDGSPEEIKAGSAQVAEALADHYMDRWRNDKKNGYQTIMNDLGMLKEDESITSLVYDDHPQFRENAKKQAAFFVDKLVNSKMKITPGFLSERVSHGPNHEYRLQLEHRVDLQPDEMSERIFGVKLDADALSRFRMIAGMEGRQEVQGKRVADGLKPNESDFWYLVRMGYQRGEIKDRDDLARFTLDQMKRYG